MIRSIMGAGDPFPSQTFAPGTEIGSLVVSEAGALARKSVLRAMGVLVVSAGYVSTICSGSN
jgi:hypothetical protein